MVGLWLTGCSKDRPAFSQPAPAVSVAKPVDYPVQTYYEYNGNLEAVEMVHIRARVKGFLNEITFTEGDEVRQGDLLFKIDPREYAAAVKRSEADLSKAAAELKHARLEEERGMRLRGTAALSAEEFANRVAARETAAAMLSQAQAALEAAQLQLSFTELHSPISGQISRTLVTRGNLVGQNDSTLLTTIVSVDPIYVYFDVPEQDLVENRWSLGGGLDADALSQTIPVELGVANEEGYPHSGKIDFRENRVDAGTGTVRIRGRIPNPRPSNRARLLYPGLYARVRIPAGKPRMLPNVPEDAVMTGQEGPYVYVLGEGNIIQKRSVKLGPHAWKARMVAAATKPDEPPSGWTLVATDTRNSSEARPSPVHAVVAIESGLTSTEQIVIKGLTKARPGLEVVPESWELSPPRSVR
jgi:multidrug efflux system membrane fusion protein